MKKKQTLTVKENQNTIKSDIQVKNSRYKMLQDMEKNLEGYNRSVKDVTSGL